MRTIDDEAPPDEGLSGRTMTRFEGIGTAALMVLLVFPPLLPPDAAQAEIIVFDQVAVTGTPVMLSAKVKGALFGKGGERVEFFVDDRSIGRTISGGDGAAYREYRPEVSGVRRVGVRSDSEWGEGFLFVLGRGAEIVFIDVEELIVQESFSIRTRAGGQKAIGDLSRRHPVVYLLSGELGYSGTKDWLNEHGFIDPVLLPWSEGRVFEEIGKKGLAVRAVVGSPSVIETARRHTKNLFSFEKADGAEKVKQWGDIGKKLR